MSIFGLGYWAPKALGLAYEDAAPTSMIGASSHFEVAIATAATLFGLGSGAALATVVGVLIQVPVMLMLVRICLRTRGWFPSKARPGEPARDLAEVLPYLNAVINHATYNKDGPSLTFMKEFRLITVDPRRITMSKARNSTDAWQVLDWLRQGPHQRHLREAGLHHAGARRAPPPDGAPDLRVASTNELQGARGAHVPGLCGEAAAWQARPSGMPAPLSSAARDPATCVL